MTDEPHDRRRAAAVTESTPEPAEPPEPARAAKAADATGTEPAEHTAVLLTAPREGTPTPIATQEELAEVARRFAQGHGPVAVDAERASGYRYTQRAYLIQLRRNDAGTVLIDPLPFRDLRVLTDAIADAEWVLHAASQDLPCLADLGMLPRRLFDTELAARLAGCERVGLAALTENLLGYVLEKHHSAADWSTRPLPESWLTYAALDVELLLDLRDLLEKELSRQGKLEWAREEFAALVAGAGAPARTRPDPWRRTSGIHRVRGARALARVRSLWYARDEVARTRDTSPGRVLSDAALVTAAQSDPATREDLFALSGFTSRGGRRLAQVWLDALSEARTLMDQDLPTSPPADGPPPAHRWAERDPVAARRLARSRATVAAQASSRQVPPENLLAPDLIRRIAWSPPEPLDRETVAAALTKYGARTWQIELAVDDLVASLQPAVATMPATAADGPVTVTDQTARDQADSDQADGSCPPQTGRPASTNRRSPREHRRRSSGR